VLPELSLSCNRSHSSTVNLLFGLTSAQATVTLLHQLEVDRDACFYLDGLAVQQCRLVAPLPDGIERSLSEFGVNQSVHRLYVEQGTLF